MFGFRLGSTNSKEILVRFRLGSVSARQAVWEGLGPASVGINHTFVRDWVWGQPVPTHISELSVMQGT